jgi:hypothetical protein
VADLGSTPLANSYLTDSDLDVPEPLFPLKASVCENCWLVQLEHVVDPEAIFRHYAYFSSVSESWLRHSDSFAETMISQLDLNGASMVMEVASNDGYLLRSFRSRGIPVLGIEPAQNVAESAIEAGIPTRVEFLTPAVAAEIVCDRVKPDLLIGNNVLAHVPDINNFVKALASLMSERTLLTMEFPHVLNLISEVQFDTIYHEHYSYLSLHAVEYVFARHGLNVVDIDRLPTHGGSLRVHVRIAQDNTIPSDAVTSLRDLELAKGLTNVNTYKEFAAKVGEAKTDLIEFLGQAKAAGQSVAAYGAAAKGNTLLNTCKVTTDNIGYVVDRSPFKQGLYLPGSRLPILNPEHVFSDRPDYLLILPWNIAPEIMSQMAAIGSWGGQFVLPIPTTRIVT